MRIRFDGFSFDPDRRELTRGSSTIRLSPKALLLLETLLTERPKVIRKQDLQTRLWPDVVVDDANLTNLVSELRTAFADDPKHPKFVKTVHGYGYAFVGEANEVSVKKPRRAALATLAPALAFVFISFFSRTATVSRASLPSMTVEALPLESLRSAAISPDRRLVAYATKGAARKSMRLRQLDTGFEAELTPADDAEYLGHPRFSPDGKWVYYLRGLHATGPHDELKRVPVLGGPAETIVDLPNGLGASFALSPDGSQLAYARESNDFKKSVVVLSNADGTKPRDVATFVAPEALCCSMSWSRNASKLLAGIQPVDDDAPKPKFNFAVVDLKTGAIDRLISSSERILFNADWMPDGRGFVAVDDQLHLDYVSYPERRISLLQPRAMEFVSVDVVDDSTLLGLAVASPASLWIVDLDKPAAFTQIAERDVPDDDSTGSTVTWTADDRIVFSAKDRLTDSSSLQICDADGGDGRQLTRAAPRTRHVSPAASPDGKTILFSEQHYQGGGWATSRIFRIGADGRDLVALTPPDRFSDNATYTPDGKWILFNEGEGTASRLMRMAASGGASRPIVAQRPCTASWGTDPAGKRFACCHLGVESVVDLARGKLLWEKDIPAVLLRWTSRGELTYADDRGGNVWLQPLDGKPPQKLTNLTNGATNDFAWSPSGRRVVIVRRINRNTAYLLKNVPMPSSPASASTP